VPLAPAVTVIQDALLVAVHAQPAVAVTVTVADPPLAAGLADVGDALKLHGNVCVIVTVWPATVSVPVREVVPVFAATLYVTVPLPVPLAPAVTVIQDALLVAVHAQPAVAVTVTVADPPLAAGLADVGDAEYAQGAVNANVLDWALGVLPPGPTDAMSDT